MNAEASVDATVSYLQRRLRPSLPPPIGYSPPSVAFWDGGTWQSFSAPAALGQALAVDAEFQALRLGGLLNSADGQLLSRAVALAFPRPYRSIYQLLVAGLQEAARLQQAGKRKQAADAVALTLLGAGVLGLAVTAAKNGS